MYNNVSNQTIYKAVVFNVGWGICLAMEHLTMSGDIILCTL